MENTFVEILSILEDGPTKGKESVFIEVFEIILSLTGQKEAHHYFSNEFIKNMMPFTGKNSPFNGVIFKIFINIFSDEEISQKISEGKDTFVGIVDFSIDNILDKNSANADHGCMLLSNITRCQKNCELVMENILSFEEVLLKLISAFSTINFNISCSLDQLAMVICNFSQLSQVRNILTNKTHCILQKLVPFINHDSVLRRKGVIGVVRNCAFDSTVHEWMLSNEVDILPYLLLPLAGPEQFDEEDNDKLPIDLQYLPETKMREPDPDVRKLVLETLNQLCATKVGRQFLRDHNTYIILRELHKWEQNQSVLVACENVVDILIRTEDEIGLDHLKDVDIPENLEEKFNKELAN